MSKIVIPARQYIRGLADKFLQGDEAALLLGLALGERSGLSARVQEAFSNTGTTHVLAVSGLHVVLVAFILFLILRIFRVPRRWAALGTCFGLVFYTLLTGSPPSIVRATIMAVAVLMGGMFERQGNGLNMLGLAGLLILFFWPQSLFDVGFQLSFAATAGILAVTRPIQNQLFRITENEVLARMAVIAPGGLPGRPDIHRPVPGLPFPQDPDHIAFGQPGGGADHQPAFSPGAVDGHAAILWAIWWSGRWPPRPTPPAGYL